MTGTRSSRLVGVVLVLGLLAGGCSTVVTGRPFPAEAAPSEAAPSAAADPGAAPSAAPAALPDACSLLTQEEASTVASLELSEGKPAGAGDGEPTLCQFVAPPSGPVGQVEVFVGDGAAKILDIERQLNHVITPLPGVGDEAYEEDGNVFLRKGQVWAAIRLVRLNDPAENREPLRTAAKQVAARM